jgi:gliding motility-associated lipoprotein GldH
MRKIFFLAIISFALGSCDRNRVYEEYVEIPDNVWDVNNKVKFEVDITDTSSLYNIYINFRHADGYMARNIFMFVTTTYMDGKSEVDTVEILLADETGKWMGDGLGDIWDNQKLFKSGVRFQQAGKYIYELEHAMRIEQVPLVMDVGLRVEEQK